MIYHRLRVSTQSMQPHVRRPCLYSTSIVVGINIGHDIQRQMCQIDSSTIDRNNGIMCLIELVNLRMQIIVVEPSHARLGKIGHNDATICRNPIGWAKQRPSYVHCSKGVTSCLLWTLELDGAATTDVFCDAMSWPAAQASTPTPPPKRAAPAVAIARVDRIGVQHGCCGIVIITRAENAMGAA